MALKNNPPDYISLQEATKYCKYSQEYLSLRARQGKLKAIKLGRNWVTKKEWIEEYLARVEEYKESLKSKETEKALERIKEEKSKREVLPPENLPVGDFDEREFSKVRPFPLPVFRYAVVGMILVLLIGGGVFFGKSFFGDVFQKTSKLMVAVGVKEEAGILKSALETFRNYGQWVRKQVFILAKNLQEVPEKIARGYELISRIWKEPEKIVEEPTVPEPGARKGMVVIPSPQDKEAVKEKIKMAFSDEVRVEPEDKASGIIVPIFKEKEGSEYMYVLVPVEEQNKN